MQSLISHSDNLHTPLGERRGKSDLDRFSLDLSWARAVSDNSRSRAYPSPPMSGSPPIPPRPNLESSDRGHGNYGSSGQGIFRGLQTPQIEHSEQRSQPLRAFAPDAMPPIPYPGPYSLQNMPPIPTQYQQLPQILQQQQQQQQQQPQQQHGEYPTHLPQPQATFATPDRTPGREPPEFSSPKQQRKTKGHVASACVPCKRAHLRCDAQRPCSRCLSNGKEDACVDVQHKKRGRPRLRDEREPRYEGVAQGYPVPEHSMRRPLPIYTPGDSSQTASFGDPLHRTGGYRVLKSQGPMSGHLPPRYLEHASGLDANIYSGPVISAPRAAQPSELACAFLTMEMQIVKASPSFGETIGLQSIISRSFQDIVIGNDRDKVARLQRGFEDERREREPNYLPPIYLTKYEEDRVIQNIAFGSEEVGQFRPDRQEMFTFQAPDGQQRTFQVRLRLAKKESTYYIVIVLHIPATPQMFQQASSPYTRESHSRDSQYGYQTAQQGYVPNQSPSSYGTPAAFPEPRMDMNPYRAPSTLSSTTPAIAAGMSGFAQPQPRTDYSQGSTQYQVPRSELQQGHQQRQHDLQLPPIRDQRSEVSSVRRDDRSGRLDIGGLLEHPGPGQRRA